MEQHNNIISLIAVFFALGIGILVGTSMGENALIMNQIEVIERLKDENLETKKKLEEQQKMAGLLQEKLSYWEELESSFLNPYFLEGELEDLNIVAAVQDELPGELEKILDLSGCNYTALVIAESPGWDSFYSRHVEAGEKTEADLPYSQNIPKKDVEREPVENMVYLLDLLLEKELLQVIFENKGSGYGAHQLGSNIISADILMMDEKLNSDAKKILTGFLPDGMQVVCLRPGEQEGEEAGSREPGDVEEVFVSWQDFKSRLQMVEKLQKMGQNTKR